MSILVDSQIAELLESKAILNSHPSHVNPASLDICIGNNLLILTPERNYTQDITHYSDKSPYYVLPNERVLANSYEYFKFPIDVAGEFKLKSSVARNFFQHMKAGWIDPGWHGSLTMEFINFGHTSYPVFPGKRIGQIIFHHLNPAPLAPYQGKYNGQIKAQPAL